MPHAGQPDAFAKARVLQDLAQGETADDNDGHFGQPRRVHCLLLHAAEDDVQHGQGQAHGDFVDDVRGPDRDRPGGDGQEHGHGFGHDGAVHGHGREDGERNGEAQGPFDQGTFFEHRLCCGHGNSPLEKCCTENTGAAATVL